MHVLTICHMNLTQSTAMEQKLLGCLFLYAAFFLIELYSIIQGFLESNINVFPENNNLYILYSHPTMGREKMISSHVEGIIY